MNYNDDEAAISGELEEDGLVNITSGELKMANDDFDQLLIPATTTLLQAI